jgi:hypothetical protein
MAGTVTAGNLLKLSVKLGLFPHLVDCEGGGVGERYLEEGELVVTVIWPPGPLLRAGRFG